VEDRRISLGLKQLKDDPLKIFAKKYPVESNIIGTIYEMLPRGVIVSLGKGLKGFVPFSHLTKKNIKKPEEGYSLGDKLKLKVIEIDVDRRNIVLSEREYEKEQQVKIEEMKKKEGDEDVGEEMIADETAVEEEVLDVEEEKEDEEQIEEEEIEAETDIEEEKNEESSEEEEKEGEEEANEIEPEDEESEDSKEESDEKGEKDDKKKKK
jgi:small subunit ribosomal protein S1